MVRVMAKVRAGARFRVKTMTGQNKRIATQSSRGAKTRHNKTISRQETRQISRPK